MVWFDPELTFTEEQSYIFPGGPGVKHKVGRWPHPNVNRANAQFIHAFSDPTSHTAYRRLFCVEMLGSVDPVAFPNWVKFGHWDLTAFGDAWLLADCPANEHGWRAHVEIRDRPILPIEGVPGVLFTMFVNHDASGHRVTIDKEYREAVEPWQWDTDAQIKLGVTTTVTTTVGFPFGDPKILDWAMSDCFLFPREAPPVAGFARFDGIDSYIKNRSRTNDTTGAWRQEFDIRLHGTGFNHYLCKSFNTTRLCVIRFSRIQYINRVVEFSTDLNLNQWYHIDFRYQWDSPDGLYRVSVDGGPDDTAANTNFNARWDQFGKRGSQAPVGEFDMRNFVLTNGPSSSPIVYLDQKFDTNACDDGPDARHGDTFFMSLPSCP